MATDSTLLPPAPPPPAATPFHTGTTSAFSTGPIPPQADPIAPPHTPRRSPLPWIIVAVLVAVALLAGVGYIAVTRGWIPGLSGGATQSARPATSTSPSADPTPSPEETSATPSASPTPTPTPAQTTAAEDPAALLAGMRSQDIASLSLNGRWIAQLSSKYNGVTDATQIAANGTSTFYDRDILIEHTALRQRFTSQGVTVYLLQATDFGKQRAWPGTLWVTIADPGLGSKEAVQQWCSLQFTELNSTEVENVCLPRQLNPPSS